MLDRQRESWLQGTPASVEELLRGSPHEDDPEALLDLVYHEIVVQEEMGLEPPLDAYLLRYPHLETELRLHFEVHKAFQQRALLETPDHHDDPTWPQSATSEEAADTELPDYQIIRALGHGGMATVYLARHRQLHRDVALKMFKSGREITAREVFRIRTEAEALARLAHPNIIQIYEIGESRGAPFLALEYAGQGTLAEKLQKLPLSADTAAQLTETLARALEAAHQRHIVHRDLKPANILFANDGTPRIADFGLAKVLQDTQISVVQATRTGESMGTPRYMAPEQAAGQLDLVGPLTDVYALGNLLYECLTGRAPFLSSGVVETARMICHDEPLPPRRFQADIPRDLETICLRCLEKAPARRYPSALALAEDLRRYRCGEPIVARRTPLWERGVKWCRRRPAQAMVWAIAVIGALSVIFGAAYASYVETRRLADLRSDISFLMQEGRHALQRDELEVAQSRFQEAWQKVQANPELSDHETSVAGWLDHTRHAMNRYRWKQRVPPRDFDDRRDEALLLSTLPFTGLPEPIGVARAALDEALELTLPDDFSWRIEREQLVLLQQALIARQSGAAAAVAYLDEFREFDSRRFHMARAALLEQLRRRADADAARLRADQFPAEPVSSHLEAGMDALRGGEFERALNELEFAVAEEPEHFAARLLQALCLLRLHRPAEAKIALTACIAQRPRFAWSYLLRGQAHAALGASDLASRDFASALAGRVSDALRLVMKEEHLIQSPPPVNETVPDRPPSALPKS